MSDTREATLLAIQAQGELVRKLKAAKETPEKVHVHNCFKTLDVQQHQIMAEMA